MFKSLKRAPDGLVFHGPLGGRVKPDTLRNILIKDVLQPLKGRFPSVGNEKGFEHGRLHSFRHFFCSQCANNGVSERALMAWLGHADAAMVRRYYHLDAKESQRQMDRVSIPVVNAGNGTASTVTQKGVHTAIAD
jgi:integrase